MYYRGSGFYKCFRCFVRSRNDLDESESGFVRLDSKPFTMTGGPPEFIPLWGETSQSVRPAIEYLEGRGIDVDIRTNAFIGACLLGRYSRRVIVPHLDADGEWWGWSARLFEKIPGVRSYDYPPNMSRDRLYNQQVLYVETDVPVMVVEGVMDALLYLPHAVACLGQPTTAHLDILKRAKRPVAMCLDGDRWYVSKQWARMLGRKKVRVGWVCLPHGKDPNDVDAAALRDAANRCIGGNVRC